MEDYELVTRLRKHGRPAIVPQAMTTSGRRWQHVGFVQTTLINQVPPLSPPSPPTPPLSLTRRAIQTTHTPQAHYRNSTVAYVACTLR